MLKSSRPEKRISRSAHINSLTARPFQRVKIIALLDVLLLAEDDVDDDDDVDVVASPSQTKLTVASSLFTIAVPSNDALVSAWFCTTAVPMASVQLTAPGDAAIEPEADVADSTVTDAPNETFALWLQIESISQVLASAGASVLIRYLLTPPWVIETAALSTSTDSDGEPVVPPEADVPGV